MPTQPTCRLSSIGRALGVIGLISLLMAPRPAQDAPIPPGNAGLTVPAIPAGEAIYDRAPTEQASEILAKESFAALITAGAPLDGATSRFSLGAFEALTSFGPAPAPQSEPAFDVYSYHYSEAKTHRAAKRWSDAMRETALAIEANPSAHQAHLLRAELYAEKELYAHAVATINAAMALCPDNAGWWAYRAAYRCSNRDSAGGMADYDEALRRVAGRPEFEASYRMTRTATYASLGDDRRCVDEYDALLTDDTTDADALGRRGGSLLRLGEYDRAIGDFDRALAVASTPTLRLLRGLARLRSGRFADALDDLEATGVAFPQHLPTQCLLALARFAVGRRAEAVAQLDGLLKDHPDAGEVQASRGWVALLAGDFTRAHTLLSQATDHADGRLLFRAWGGSGIWANKEIEWASAEFEARCRAFPSLRWAFVVRPGSSTGGRLNPFNLALVCRVLPDPSLAPCLVISAIEQPMDHPERGFATLGECIAAACLLDRSKLLAAAPSIASWARGPKSLAKAWQEW